MDKNKTKSISVTGDLVSDWMLIHDEAGKNNQTWSFSERAYQYQQWGGYFLLHTLISKIIPTQGDSSNWHTISTLPLPEIVEPENPNFNHSFSIWAQFPNKGNPQGKNHSTSWRVENILGIGHKKEVRKSNINEGAQKTDDDLGLLIIDDSNLGYRDDPYNWHSLLTNYKGWIVLKMATPLAQGSLWEELINYHAEKLIIITTANDLRMTSIQVSKNISWERTAQDVVWELTYNPNINSLTQAAFNIISFHCAGSILLARDKSSQIQGQLIFDPAVMEGDWEISYPGSILGYTTCLTGSIAHQIMIDIEKPDLIQAIQSGTAALRKLHKEGYDLDYSDPLKPVFGFPFNKIAQEIGLQEKPLTCVMIQDPTLPVSNTHKVEETRIQPSYWTILEDRYTDELIEIARKIVLHGSECALTQVPIGKFGALVTVDRREIEALNGIQRLISEYCSGTQKKPLSIAVFGPPGSGKSFGVEQVAKKTFGGIAVLNFNLSQFQTLQDLTNAFHQVRDIGLSGKIPLVFWDEFDTSLNGQSLGWLRYFLAPMQDGTFQEGQIVHPIGRSIFVFAGGISHRMDEFGNELPEYEQKSIKLPDFVSRLKGFLNIMGPNPIKESVDPYFVIRRALILRSLFERNTPSILHFENGKRVVHVDTGLLSAFLLTSQYRHGIRSMESIISMSTLAGKTSFDQSSLPTEEQLNLHVDGIEFLSLIQKLELRDEILERLAEAAHDVFCSHLRMEGYVWGEVTDNIKKTHSCLTTYSELPDFEKEQNRAIVRDIPEKLAIAGYIMHPARSNESPFSFPGKDLEKLAEYEHDRWTKHKEMTGWKYANKTDKYQKFHKLLVPWEKLAEEEKEKDRILIRGIPYILAKAGFAVEKIDR